MKGDSAKLFYLPLLVLLIILIIDKLVLLPPIMKCCVKSGQERNYTESGEDRLTGYDLNELRRNSTLKNVVVMGSSLSMGFKYLERNREMLLGHYPESRLSKWRLISLAYPASTILTHYTRLKQLLERNIRPDLIILEFAPSVLNSETPTYRTELMTAMPLTVVLKNYFEIPPGIRDPILLGTIFASLRYPPILNNKSENVDLELMARQISDIERYETEEEAELRQNEPQLHRSFYPLFFKLLKSIADNYRADPELVKLLHQFVKITNQQQIPLLLWYPPIHPDAYRIVNTSTQHQGWSDVVSGLPPGDYQILNLNEEGFSCNRYVDPVHIHRHCFINLLKEFDKFDSSK